MNILCQIIILGSDTIQLALLIKNSAFGKNEELKLRGNYELFFSKWFMLLTFTLNNVNILRGYVLIVNIFVPFYAVQNINAVKSYCHGNKNIYISPNCGRYMI